ncbi:MAG: phosphoenolpyruvate-utilizing N-terminal domain-containing protein [Pyrinomonadaceae bacterium]
MTDGIGTSHFENLKTNGEIRITARAVSRGVSSGKVVCLYGSRRQFYRIYLRKIQIDGELKRFRAAVQLAKLQLKKFSKHKSTISDETKINIFDAHYLILEDDSLIFKIENVIAEKR